MRSRWTRIRHAMAEMSDMIEIGRAVEANRMSIDQARAAMASIDASRAAARAEDLSVERAEVASEPVSEQREVELAGSR